VDQTPTLDEYRETEDPEGVWTESELQALFREAHPDVRLTNSSGHSGTLRERRLAALRRLEGAVSESPANTHPIDTWFDPSISGRLRQVNILTLGALVATINTFGYRWFARIPKLGPETAQRIVTWLQANEGALTPGVHTRATTPLRSQSVTTLRTNKGESAAIACFENLTLPPLLAGREGANRAPTNRNKTGAQDDWQAVQAWLTRHPAGSPTWRSYRTQAERLLLWSVFERSKALSSLDVSDIAAYRQFLEAPPDRWIAPRNVHRWSVHWRPFAGPLAPSSRAAAHRILGGLFQWLVDLRYLDFNPWQAARSTPIEREAANAKAFHALTREQYKTVENYVEARADTAWGQRGRFMLLLAFATGLRVSELSTATLGSLESKWVDESLGSAWTLVVKGKGSKIRRVPIPVIVMDALGRYLAERGLSEDPSSWDARVFLIGRLTRNGQHAPGGVAAPALAIAFKRIFLQVAGYLASTNPQEAYRLSNASTHWLRHTFGTRAIEAGMPLDVVQENLGHASPSTTSKYVTTELDRRIRAVESFMRK